MSPASAGRPAGASAPQQGTGVQNAAAAGDATTAGAQAPSTGPGDAPVPRRWAGAAGWCLPAAAAAAVMTGISLWGLARQNSMGNDEVATRYAATISLPQLFFLLRHVDAVHGTYYLLMQGWAAAFGSTATALRVPSVIAMAAGAALIVISGRRLTGSAWAGLVAGVIMALTPAISYYAQTARSYALVLACVVASVLALLRALQAEAAGEAGGRLARWWVLYGAAIIVSSYLNEMALLVLAANLVTVLLARYRRAALRHFLITAVASVVIIVPLLALSVSERAAVGWIPRPDLKQAGILFHDYFGGTTLIASIIFAFAVVALLPPAGWFRRTQDAASRPWWRLGGVCVQSLALPLVTLPAGLLMAESVAGHALYVDRYVLYGEAGGALLAGAGAYRTGQWLQQQARGWLAARSAGGAKQQPSAVLRAGLPALLVIPGVAACLCALLLNLHSQRGARTPGSRMYDFGSPAFYIGAHAQPGDGVLFFSEFYRKIRYAYPAQFRGLSDFAMAQTPQQAGTFNGTDKPLPAVESAIPGYRRIWVVGNPPSPYLTSPVFQAESQLLARDYRLAATEHDKGMSVTLWIARTGAKGTP